MARPRRLLGSSEVRVGCPPLGRAERTFWVRLRPYGWISSFFIAFFGFTQLASSIAVPGVPLDPQEELMVTRDHRSVPFWDPLSQPAFWRIAQDPFTPSHTACVCVLEGIIRNDKDER